MQALGALSLPGKGKKSKPDLRSLHPCFPLCRLGNQ
jgi:hypothetical protein